MKHLLILLAMAMAPVAMNAQDNSKEVQPEKATTKACCSKDKKEGAACHKDGKNDEKVCDKDSKEAKACCKDGKGDKACCKDGKEAKACCKEDKKDGMASDSEKKECKKTGKKGCCSAKKAAYSLFYAKKQELSYMGSFSFIE